MEMKITAQITTILTKERVGKNIITTTTVK